MKMRQMRRGRQTVGQPTLSQSPTQRLGDIGGSTVGIVVLGNVLTFDVVVVILIGLVVNKAVALIG